MRAGWLGVGLAGLPWAARASEIASWDLETNDGGFTNTDPSDQWQWGVISGPGPGGGHDGARAWGTQIGGNYLVDVTDSLVFPSVDISPLARPVVHFWQWYDIHPAGDFGLVEAWNGSTWVRLEPVYGYPEKAGVTGVSGTWVETFVDLTDVGLLDLHDLRFTFVSDPSIVSSGWYLDDLSIHDGDDIPPRVTIIGIPVDNEGVQQTQDVSVTAEDDDTLGQVTLNWTANGAPAQTMPFSVSTGTTYVAQIPGVPNATEVDWWVTATDASGNSTRAPATGSESYTVALARPTDLHSLSDRLIAPSVELAWAPPASIWPVDHYTLYRDGDAVVALTTDDFAVAPVRSATHTFTVTAWLQVDGKPQESAPSDPLTLSFVDPTVDLWTPTAAYQGDHLRLDLVGRSLLMTDATVALDLGPNVTVDTIDVLDSNHMRAELSIDADAAIGERDLVLTVGPLVLAEPSAFSVLDGAGRPALLSLDPDGADQGDTLTLRIDLNAPLNDDLLIDLGEGVIVGEITDLGVALDVDLAIAQDAPVGAHALLVDDGLRVLEGLNFYVRPPSQSTGKQCACAGVAPSPDRPPTLLLSLGPIAILWSLRRRAL